MNRFILGALALLALVAPAAAQQQPGQAIVGTLPAFAATPTFNLGTLNGAALDASVQAVKTTLGSPFQAGGSVGITGTLPAYAATPTFNLGALNGAATAAKQPAIGVSGTPSADVLTVQFPTGQGLNPPTTTAVDASGTLAAGGTATALAASAGRQSLLVTNTGANPMSFRFGATASATNGHIVGPGQTLVVSSPVPGGSVGVYSANGTTWFATSN